MKPSPAPWEAESNGGRKADETYYDVRGPDGKVLFDTCNSEVMVIESDHDEDGSHYWDEQGRVNMQLAAAAPDMLELLRDYERWQGDLVLCDEAWRNSLPTLTYEMMDRLNELQLRRNAIIAKATK
jgi:hypothetical protein